MVLAVMKTLTWGKSSDVMCVGTTQVQYDYCTISQRKKAEQQAWIYEYCCFARVPWIT